MADLYPKNPKTSERRPRTETIRFLLNYSKAVRFTPYKKTIFEAFMN